MTFQQHFVPVTGLEFLYHDTYRSAKAPVYFLAQKIYLNSRVPNTKMTFP